MYVCLLLLDVWFSVFFNKTSGRYCKHMECLSLSHCQATKAQASLCESSMFIMSLVFCGMVVVDLLELRMD